MGPCMRLENGGADTTFEVSSRSRSLLAKEE